MALMRLQALSFSYGDHVLLDEVSLVLHKGERYGLIGRNGAGKSTLMRILSGEETPDGGEIWRADGLKVSRLEQEVPNLNDQSIYENVVAALAELGEQIAEYHRLSQQSLDAAGLKRLEQVQQRIEAEDGWQIKQRVESVLERLALPADTPLSSLSGGWRRRVALAKALVRDPDVLLLDEPTNHLDIDTIQWLENQLTNFPGTIIVITHDRAFLDAVANRILLLDRGHITTYESSYSEFLQRREAELEIEARHNAEFDKRLAEEEKWIRQGIKARRTRNEGRVRALKSMREERARRRIAPGKAQIQLADTDSSGKLVIELDEVSFAYDDKIVIRSFSTTILRGDRIAILGKNGSGKSTLLKLMLGELQPTSGTVKRGSQLSVAYFDQDRAQINPELSVIDNLSEGREYIELNGQRRHVISYLADFLFSAERSRAKAALLSGGEYNRLLLAKLFSNPANLLILDEPTNDLDVETLELLEERLMQYQGTLIVVSHDRAFVDNVVTSTLVIDDHGNVAEHVGGYSDWASYHRRVVEQLREREQRNLDSEKQSTQSKSVESEPKAKVASKKLSYKLQRELEQLPEQLADLESQQAELQTQIEADSFYQQDHDQVARVLQQLADVEQALEERLERWVELEAMTGG